MAQRIDYHPELDQGFSIPFNPQSKNMKEEPYGEWRSIECHRIMEKWSIPIRYFQLGSVGLAPPLFGPYLCPNSLDLDDGNPFLKIGD